MVCAYRGSYKSSCATQAYVMWRALYIDSFACRIIGNSSDNVKINHFMKMVDLWMSSARSTYLQWLYEERLPPSFRGWTTEQIAFLKTQNPFAAPSITYKGIESSQEGWHGDLVVLDDPEGADADISDVPNEASFRAYQNSIPLLKEPTKQQILITLTPWGSNPLAYRLRDREAKLDNGDEINNRDRLFKLWWKPIVDPKTGEIWEPHRFTPRDIEDLAKEPMADQQYFLRRRSEAEQIFRIDEVVDNSFQYLDRGRSIIQYPAFEFDLEAMRDLDYRPPARTLEKVRVEDLRIFMHMDPTHKLFERMKSKGKGQRPSKNAIVVVGVAPDSHAFVLDWWAEDSDVDELVLHLRRLFFKWKKRCHRVHKITYEGTGAQDWLKNLVQSEDRNIRQAIGYARLRGRETPYPEKVALKMMPSSKTNQSKDSMFQDELAPWVNHGILHFHLGTQQPLIDEMQGIADMSVSIDLIDALTQGPAIWSPPIDPRLSMAARRRQQYAQKARAEQAHRRGPLMPTRTLR